MFGCVSDDVGGRMLSLEEPGHRKFMDVERIGGGFSVAPPKGSNCKRTKKKRF